VAARSRVTPCLFSGLLEIKDAMRRRGALSPDLADAVVLTFAQPVTLKPSRFHPKIEYPPTRWM
jgi:hypothetical protein